MTLYWPRLKKDIDLTAPRLHALVIGVADYPHLMGGAGQPAAVNFGLSQLTTTRFTAIRIAEWLNSQYQNPDCSLGSIELLLSPAEKLTRVDNSKVTIENSTMANIREAFNRWYARCNSQAGNIAFFYFAGHGVSKDSQYLMAADALDPNLPNDWANIIDFDGMRLGMKKNAADTQLFFVDACREKPIDLFLQTNPDGDPLVSASIQDDVSASAAYYAAADGKQAYGPPDDATYFSTAVLEALAGVGAAKKGNRWIVDTFSLGNAIGQIMASLGRIHSQPLTCNPDPEGTPVAVHFPPNGFVHLSVSCSTAQANSEAEIRLTRLAALVHSPRGDTRPWRGKVEPGDWQVQMDFQNFPPIVHIETVMGPVYELVEPI